MKLQLFVSAVLASLASVSAHGSYRQTAIYLEKNFNWGNMYDEIQQAISSGYNRFYVGFYMSVHGAQGASADWAALSSSQKQNVKSLLAANNASLYLSVGGPGEFWENCINSNCATSYGASAGAHAVSNLYDGIEVALKLAGEGTVPSPYADNGSFISMAQTLVTSIKNSGFTSDKLAISSNAPYFSPTFVSGNAGYALSTLCLTANNAQTWYVSDCNLLMFNEDGNYLTYQDIFAQNTYVDPIYGVFGQGSSVKEIMDLGIAADKIAIIKPVSEGEATVRTGYVPAFTLGNWGCNAHDDYSWQGGFIAWTWNSATDTELNQVLSFATATQACD